MKGKVIGMEFYEMTRREFVSAFYADDAYDAGRDYDLMFGSEYGYDDYNSSWVPNSPNIGW